MSLLSDEEKETIRNNLTVPTLVEYLDLAVKYNKSVIFDLKPYDDGQSAMSPEHPYYKTYQDVVIRSILQHSIAQSKVSQKLCVQVSHYVFSLCTVTVLRHAHE